jgi:hypothetical protein
VEGLDEFITRIHDSACEVERMIEEQGFKMDVVEKSDWEALPLPRNKLDPQFRTLQDDELKVKGAMLRLSMQC